MGRLLLWPVAAGSQSGEVNRVDTLARAQGYHAAESQ